MDDARPRIKFYSFGSGSLDFSNRVRKSNVDASKTEKPSKNFNDALRKVIKKDIDFLSRKIENINKEITKHLLVNGITLDMGLESNIENIDSLIKEIENLISRLIIEKGNIKIGLFTRKKKMLREKIAKLQESIDYLSKCQNDFISIKNEYDKLSERSLAIFDEPESDSMAEEKKEDALERTINFYMRKEERA